MGPEATGSSSDVRLLTFLIADVRGYTRFTRERGDAAAAMLAKTFADRSREAVEARNGLVIELRGDEALAVFEVPAQAVLAALEFQATCMEESGADPTFPLPVGIGIDTGEAVPVEDGYRGVALNMAARLCSNAGAGQVLVTRAIVEHADLPSGEVSFLERGPASFKGFEEAVDVIEAVWPHPVGSVVTMDGVVTDGVPPELDPLTPLVDRDHEMRWLRGTWRQVRRGKGRVLFVSGLPQMGKTRLAAELAAHVEEGAGSVRYAGPGGAATALALAAIREATQVARPTLLVIDDIDVAGPEVAEALSNALGDLHGKPVLVVGLLRAASGGHELGRLIERIDRRGDGHRVLSSFGPDGVREIVRLYVGEDVADVPLESMMRSSEGVPGRIHEVASDWARSEAARRLEAAAEFLAAGRKRQASDLDFANNVIGLKLGRLYTVEGRDAVGDGRDACPYKGLASFDERDSMTFFGRERLVGELAARTVQAGVLTVVGASGSGKSSVVAAGLLPSLSAGLLPGSERWRQRTMRPGEHPLRALRSSLATLGPGLEGVEDPLASLVSEDARAERLVLVIDQFEETFTLCDSEEERARFLQTLATAANSPDKVALVLSIRSDYYGHVAPYPDLGELLAANHVLVPPMTRDELRRAIELPARRAGLRIEQALVDALVEEVAEEPGGLPLLSTALVELWQAREGGWIRTDAYERTGGVRGAVARLAEASYERLTDSQKEAARPVFLRLVGAGEGDAVTRRRVPMDEFDLERDAAADIVIRHLVQDRLLTLGDGTVEVAHEALLREWPRVRGWLEEDAQGRQLRQHLTLAARQWDAGGREPSELYRGARLSGALEWATAHGQELNESERQFLGASREASEHEAERQRRTNRRLRSLLVGVALFLVLALVAGALALIQRGNARRAADRAERAATVALSQSLGAQAVAEPRLDTALLLARQATAIDDSVRTRSNLLTSLLKAPTVTRVFHGTVNRINGLAVSPDGTRLAIADNAQHVVVADAATGQTIGDVPSSSSDVAIVPDGSVLRPILEDTSVASIEAVDPVSGDIVGTFAVPREVQQAQRGGEGQPRQRYAYDPVHDRLAAALSVDQIDPSSGFVVQWDLSTGEVVGPPIQIAKSRLINVGYTADGRTLMVAGHSTAQYDARSGKRLFSIAAGGFSAAMSPAGDTIAIGYEDGSVRFVYPATGKIVRANGNHSAGVTALDFTPDGQTLISSSDDGETFLWDVGSRAVRETLSGHAGNVHSQALSADGSTLYTGGFDTTVLAYDLTGRRSFVQTFQAADTDERFFAYNLAVSPDSRTIAVGDTSGNIHLWDLRTLQEIESFHAVPGIVAAVSFGPDGRSLLVAGDSQDLTRGWLRMWDVVGEPELLTEMQGGFALYSWAVLSPDGKTVAATGRDLDQDLYCCGKVAEWDATTGRLLAPPMTIDGGEPVHVAFLPQGTEVAIAGANGLVAVLDPARSTILRRWATEAEFTDAVAFSPDGRTLATADFSGFVRTWDWRGGKEGRPPEIGSPIHASEVEVNSLAWSPDGTSLATVGGGTLRLYDVTSRRQIGTSVSVSPLYPYVAFTADGRDVVAADADAQTWVWPVSLDAWQSRACTVANRNLTRAEWNGLVGLGNPYQRVCL